MIVGNVVGAAAVATLSSARSLGVSTRDDVMGGRSAVANGSSGVFISRGTNSTQAGGSNSGEGNTIANNGGNGVEVRTLTSKKNSIKAAIPSAAISAAALRSSTAAPRAASWRSTISSVLNMGLGGRSSGTRSTTTTVQIAGTAASSGTVEVFNDTGSQGETLVGRTTVGANQSWTLAAVEADLTHEHHRDADRHDRQYVDIRGLFVVRRQYDSASHGNGDDQDLHHHH